jgi:hypothetical protein
MDKTLDGLHILIHLADGSVGKFFQEQPDEIQRILGNIVPARFFGQPTLIIGGGYSASAFPTSAITHILFEHSQLPNWADLNDETEMHEIPREEFLVAANPPPDKMQPRDRQIKEGESMTGYGRLGLHGGGKIYVKINAYAARRLEQRHLVQRIFQAPYYYVRREGGALLINTANLISVSLFPGPSALPATAWPAHHLME